MIRFEDIYETVRSHHPGTDLELLRKADADRVRLTLAA